MNLIHHAQHVMRGPIRCPAQGEFPTGLGKPNGFWFSVQGHMDWERWCRSHRWRLKALRYQYLITLDPAYPILLIDTERKMQWFDEVFSVVPGWAREYDIMDYKMIDWEPICWAWAGIIIAPYQWAYRHGLSWYYGWDCASGVVWNEDAIVGYERIK